MIQISVSPLGRWIGMRIADDTGASHFALMDLEEAMDVATELQAAVAKAIGAYDLLEELDE